MLKYNQIKEVTIAAGQSLSPAVWLGGSHYLVAIVMPAAWDAAAITLQASMEDRPLTGDGTPGNFLDVYDGSSEVSFTVAASRHQQLSQGVNANWLKIRSGTAGVPVAQTAAATLRLVIRSIE